MTDPRRTIDLCAAGLALAVSSFLVLVGVTAWGGLSVYSLVLGVTGAVGFGLIAIQFVRRRSLARGDRWAVTAVAVFVGVLSGSVVVLPLLLLVAIWFAVSAALVRNS